MHPHAIDINTMRQTLIVWHPQTEPYFSPSNSFRISSRCVFASSFACFCWAETSVRFCSCCSCAAYQTIQQSLAINSSALVPRQNPGDKESTENILDLSDLDHCFKRFT